MPSSPCSECESSIASCSDLVEALEALTIELQQDQQRQMDIQGESDAKQEELVVSSSTDAKSSTLTRSSTDTEEGRRGQSPVKSLTTDSVVKIDMAEKEKILKECKNQIKVCIKKYIIMLTQTKSCCSLLLRAMCRQ